jgi:hypothetical protein
VGLITPVIATMIAVPSMAVLLPMGRSIVNVTPFAEQVGGDAVTAGDAVAFPRPNLTVAVGLAAGQNPVGKATDTLPSPGQASSVVNDTVAVVVAPACVAPNEICAALSDEFVMAGPVIWPASTSYAGRPVAGAVVVRTMNAEPAVADDGFVTLVSVRVTLVPRAIVVDPMTTVMACPDIDAVHAGEQSDADGISVPA